MLFSEPKVHRRRNQCRPMQLGLLFRLVRAVYSMCLIVLLFFVINSHLTQPAAKDGGRGVVFVSAQTPDGGSGGSIIAGNMTFDYFRKTYFVKEQRRVNEMLVPCGCISRRPLEELSNHVSKAKGYVDMTVLSIAETLLFEDVGKLFAECGCTEGVDYVKAALLAAKITPSTEIATVSEAEKLVTRLSNVLSLATEKCCNPKDSKRTFTFVSGLFTFEEAAKDAVQRGGRLAAIESRSDSVNVVNRIVGNQGPPIAEGGNGMFAWVGAASNKEKQWTWTDGNPVSTFKNWGLGEPDNTADVIKCCGVCLTKWHGGIRGQWNALTCGNKMPYVLETSGGGGENSNEQSGDFRAVTTLVAILLGLFLVASIVIVLRKVLLGNPSVQRRRRRPPRVSQQHADEDEEMTGISPGGGAGASTDSPRGADVRRGRQHPPSGRRSGRNTQHQRDGSGRRVHFPHAAHGAREEGDEEGPQRPTMSSQRQHQKQQQQRRGGASRAIDSRAERYKTATAAAASHKDDDGDDGGSPVSPREQPADAAIVLPSSSRPGSLSSPSSPPSSSAQHTTRQQQQAQESVRRRNISSGSNGSSGSPMSPHTAVQVGRKHSAASSGRASVESSPSRSSMSRQQQQQQQQHQPMSPHTSIDMYFDNDPQPSNASVASAGSELSLDFSTGSMHRKASGMSNMSSHDTPSTRHQQQQLQQPTTATTTPSLSTTPTTGAANNTNNNGEHGGIAEVV